MTITKTIQVADKEISFTFNRFAKQAAGSVMVTCGDTQVLVTACAAKEAREGQDFFPLTVDYIEKYYAAGRFPGGFMKRETKPSDRETLTARVIDRPLRPSFPDHYMCETQIVCTVMSVDEKHHPAPLALMGASTALMVSEIPFNGPVASLRVGRKNGDYYLDPSEMEDDNSELNLNIACRPDAVLMVEAGADSLSEEEMLQAINWAHETMNPIFAMQLEIQKEIGKPKREVASPTYNEEVVAKAKDMANKPIADALAISEKLARYDALSDVKKSVKAELNPDGDSDIGASISHALEDLKYTMMRNQILDTKQRIGGRGYSDVRAIECEINTLKRPHGSAFFQRGETQAIASVTLGAGEDEQRIDTILTPGLSKRFMLHYNFPAFSVGECRPQRSPGRREIGHGALAERALSYVMPDANSFGYTVRLVSEILESNGSSSMATVCSGSMAMMHAGVPLKEPVAGIAMGLIKEGDRYAVLSDILGDEDHLGDMDFKVCGGRNGITALQMDIKIGGLSKEIMAEALAQAKEGRLHILDKMQAAIESPADLSEHAPRIFSVKISTDKIRDVIGPGGKMIKKIVADTGVKIDIDDSGLVNIVSPDVASAEAAKKMIRAVIADPEVGGVYLGQVKKIVDFGAFIEITPGTEGLCHISELENKRVDKVTDILSEGEEVLVKVLDIDRQGKVKLSRRAAFDQKPTH